MSLNCLETAEAVFPLIEINVVSDVTASNPLEEDVNCTKETECIINYDAKVAEHPPKEKTVGTVEP